MQDKLRNLCLSLHITMIQDRVVRILSWLQSETTQGSNPDRAKRFLSFPKRPDRLWCPKSLLFNGKRGIFPRM